MNAGVNLTQLARPAYALKIFQDNKMGKRYANK